MHRLRRATPVALALFLAFTSASCLVSHRVITRHQKPVVPGAAPTLLTATGEELNSRIRNLYNAISSFQATVQMTPSMGSVYKGQITEIKDVHAYVLFRKPGEIRIIGQLPVVRTKEFDMVSSGNDFKVYLVSKSLFIEGSNDAPATSKNTFENLRPEAFLSSMLIRPADAPTEQLWRQDFTDEENANYILQFFRRSSDGASIIGRQVWFDRLDLSIVRQMVFDPVGETVSDTRYSKWQTYNGVRFPSHIDINRWRDGYGVVMDVTDMQMNLNLTDDKFVLNRPEGTQLRSIGTK